MRVVPRPRRRRQARTVDRSTLSLATVGALLLAILVRGNPGREKDTANPSTQQFYDHVVAENDRLQPNRRRQLLHWTLFHHVFDRLEELQDHDAGGPRRNHSHDAGLASQVFSAYAQAARHRTHATAPDRAHSLHSRLPPFPESLRRDALHRLRHMFTHAYDSYMAHAFPAPELKPMSCRPGSFPLVPIPGLTLMDTLDTLILMGNYTEFARATERLRGLYQTNTLFDIDHNVSVFETNIRVVGGLLSAHQLALAYVGHRHIPLDDDDDDDSLLHPWNATCPRGPVVWDQDSAPPSCSADDYWEYDGLLLTMALDIGARLLPAFDTPTGIPYGTVHLRHGVPPGETTIASLAGAGTLSLELELLSRLTGDQRFGKAAKLATRALFLRHSPLYLLGKHLDVRTGMWTETLSGVGSNSDSFHEYLAKHYMLFPNDSDFWIMFMAAYTGVHNHSRTGEWYPDVDMNLGTASGHVRQVLESLTAFLPGLQVLIGELVPAARTLNSMMMVREMLGFLPERFHFGLWKTDVGRGAAKHPLRPELLESCYFLHRATKDLTPGFQRKRSESVDEQSTKRTAGGDSGWQWAAEFALRKLERMTRVDCGHASVQSIAAETTGPIMAPFAKELLYDEMPSFFMSETIKYMYLIFDEDNILHTDDDREWIFTTEAHPIHSVPKAELSKETDNYMDQQVQKLKRLLSNHLHKRAQEELVASYHGDYWSERTLQAAYTKELQSIRSDVLEQRLHLANESVTFFGHGQIVDSFVPTAQERLASDNGPRMKSLAHQAFSNLGSGRGTMLRKACPNVYASDLLWLHALNGGSLDYSEMYVSVGSDNVSEHPNSFMALEAAEALGVLGSGQMFVSKLGDKLESCPVTNKQSTHHQKTQESAAADDTATPASQLMKVSSSLGDFEVETYPNGEGFYIRLVDSGETVRATFLFDNSDIGRDLILIGSGIEDSLAEEDDFEKPTASRWQRMTSKLSLLTNKDGRKGDTRDSFLKLSYEMNEIHDGRVILSDFAGNAFSCEVEVVEKIRRLADMNEDDADDGEEEEILARYPCAPALFGPTSFTELLNSGGVCIEEPAFAPSLQDPTGCERAHGGRSSVADDGSDGETSPHLDACESMAHREACELRHAIRIVRRGDCSFYSKSVNQRLGWDADGVIVINDEESELFVMSFSEDGEIVLSPEMLPCSVLVSHRDGEDLISKLAVDRDEVGTQILARICVSSQQAQSMDDTQDWKWPIVHAQPDSIVIYVKSGWGIQAQRLALGGVATSGKGEWNLQLLQHRLAEATRPGDRHDAESNVNNEEDDLDEDELV